MSFKITYEDCVKMVHGMKRMPDSPSHFLIYSCESSNVCVKMKREKFIVYYNVREEYFGRVDLLPVAFKNELTFKIIKQVINMSIQIDQWDESVRGKKMSSSSGKVIFKYQMPILEDFYMVLPKGAEILRVDDQDGMFWMWCVVDTDVVDVKRKFYSVKCGANVPDGDLKYLGFCAIFVQQELGLYIFEDIGFEEVL